MVQAAAVAIGSKQALPWTVRPRGRPPNGKHWDYLTGEWVPFARDAATTTGSPMPQQPAGTHASSGHASYGTEGAAERPEEADAADGAVAEAAAWTGRRGTNVDRFKRSEEEATVISSDDDDDAPAQQTDIGASSDQPQPRDRSGNPPPPLDHQPAKHEDTCRRCSKFFKSNAGLQYHWKNNICIFACPHCGMNLRDKRYLAA